MATKKIETMSDEDWLAAYNKSGNNSNITWVDPRGYNDPAWANSPNGPSGYTIGQGTLIPSYGGWVPYDGHQNSLGILYGDGTWEGSTLNQDVVDSIWKRLGEVGYTPSGETAAEHKALAEADREKAREAYREQRGKYGAANVTGSPANLWANSSSNPGYNPSGSGFDINRIYDAQQAAALAALERSYNASLAGYNGAKDNINAQYYEEARKAQAQSDLERQRMNQMFNANGLANGGIGQASLAQNNALLGNLNALSTANAADLSTVDTALAKLQADYQGAVAEAIANNELERAQALYQQWQDEQARALQAEQTAYDRQMDAYNMMLKEQQYRDSQTAASQKLMQSQVEDMLAMKGVTSIPDYMIEASGYDPAYINAVLTQKAQEEAAAAALRSYKGPGSGDGDGDVADQTFMARLLSLGDKWAAYDLIDATKKSEGERTRWYKWYDDEVLKNKSKTDKEAGTVVTADSAQRAFYKSMMSVPVTKLTDEQILAIYDAYDKGLISPDDMNEFLKKTGD